MGRIIEEPELHNRTQVFPDRQTAGRLLAEKLRGLALEAPLVLAIPAGGVPVAAEIAHGLAAPLELVIVRKIQLPWDPEAGFGAMNLDGDLIFNTELVTRLGLTEREIEVQVERTKKNLAHREQLFGGWGLRPHLTGHTAILVDDGLASGFTMLAALAAVARRKPQQVIVAVPTSLGATAARVAQEADLVLCLNLRTTRPFAVAAAYEKWYDVNDEEVLALLRELGSLSSPTPQS